MSTTNKLPYIKATDDTKYENLKEEVLDLHKQIDANTTNITDIESDITTVKESIQAVIGTTDGFSTEVKDEVVTARGVWPVLNDRLNAIDSYKLTYNLEKLSLNRTYEYTPEGYVTKESVRGDYEYDVIYKYDSNWNVVKEELYDISNNLMGYKEYIYDEYFNIKKVNSVNAEILSIATNSLVTVELNERLSKIENMDLIKTATILGGDAAATFVKSMQDFAVRLEILETMLPDNIANIADIPYIMEKISELKAWQNKEYQLFSFYVFSDVSSYDIPSTIDEHSSIMLEGLTLKYGDDYTIANGKITFTIPLIDDFYVVCKY